MNDVHRRGYTIEFGLSKCPLLAGLRHVGKRPIPDGLKVVCPEG